MHLTRLHCRGFRCLEELDLQPSRAINIIRGRNAQGKTSVLEAILFAATSKSHRTNVESDLVKHGHESFHIRLEVQRSDREVVLETNWWNGQKRVKVNGVGQSRLSELLGKVRVVFFAPEDIALVKAGAGERRRFMDMELSQLSPGYLSALQHYRQALRQRNELLRNPRLDPALLDVWDQQLAEHGERLIAERAVFVEELGELAAEAYRQIAGGESLQLAYAPDCVSGSFAEVLQAKRENDRRRQMTTHGPHRDEIRITVAGETARSHGSQGQQKSAALALKLAELHLIHQRTSEYPILLLDEVLAELDALRTEQLFDAIPEQVQCLLTTTDLERRVGPEGRTSAELRIEAGQVAVTEAGITEDHG